MSDVLVVGGGPAGLAATAAALDRGASVTLVDGGLRLGGQLLRQPVVDSDDSACPGAPFGPSLPARLDRISGHPRLAVLTGNSVWSISRHPSDTPAITARLEGGVVCRASAVVLATGASELLLPFRGWELPGVVSAGAGQSLLKAHHQLIGRRVVVAGSGSFLLPVAAGLAGAGAHVLAVLEALPLARATMMAPALARHPVKLAEATRYAAALARRRVRVRYGYAVVRCEGETAVERAVLARVDRAWRPVPGSEEILELDAVCVSFGFVPRLELARQLGVGERASARHPAVSVACDSNMATSVPGVFAAGELTGVAGGEAAELEGALAGHAAADHCGLEPAGLPAAVVRLRRRLQRARDFADRLESVYRLGGGEPWASMQWAGDDTVVCRCEDVTLATVRSAIGAGARSLRELRGLTRCGMGYCQGRTCGPILQLALAGETGLALDRCGDLHRRPVAVPVPLGEVSGTS